jgi:NAD+ kinase
MQPPARLGIITKPNEPRALELALAIAEWAAAHDITLYVNDRVKDLPPGTFSASAKAIAQDCDMLVALGGDGTMLATARLVAGRGTPVLGVNLGTLGYLTEFAIEDAIPALELIVRGEYEIDRRMMLDWQIVRDSDVVGHGSALNDVVVNKSALARIIDIDCSVGQHYVTTYRADGLIVATPTGSTAYNLAAGGPIVQPNVDAVVLTPIAPHTLTNRPIVIPGSSAVRVTPVMEERSEVFVTFDGQEGFELQAGDEIRVQRSDTPLRLIKPSTRSYFEVLRTKLKWGER